MTSPLQSAAVDALDRMGIRTDNASKHVLLFQRTGAQARWSARPLLLVEIQSIGQDAITAVGPALDAWTGASSQPKTQAAWTLNAYLAHLSIPQSAQPSQWSREWTKGDDVVIDAFMTLMKIRMLYLSAYTSALHPPDSVASNP